MRSLSLNFFACSIGAEAVQATKDRVPVGLASLYLNFRYCYRCDPGAISGR